MPGGMVASAGTAVLLILAWAVLVCAIAGLIDTQRNDSRHAAEQHVALQAALDELRAGNANHFDSNQVALIGQRAGLNDLRFDAELTPDTSREVQSVHDAQGRIVGWFSWAPDRAFIDTMDWLWGIAGTVALIMILGAALAMRAARRLTMSLVRSVAAVHQLTTQDAVTGLPNRRVVLERLEEIVATRRARFVALAMLDIDAFRDIDDTLGRAGGDTMLRAIAERLKSVLPVGAVFGRFEDDTFAVIATGDDTHLAAGLGDKLTGALAAPIYMDQMWQVTACVGLAQAPEDGTTGDELRRHATLALRAAKRRGRGSVRRFVPEIHEENSERRFFLRELEIAIEQKAFEVHYQPIVAAEGGAMIGVEALLRWNHPTRGAIAPSMFIPLAEESGLMNRLGEIVLRQALTDGMRWPSLFVAVNLSPVQMRSRGLVGLIHALLAETRMPASRVVLEVTEGVLIHDPDETQSKLEALRALGVSTALDDFGTGYSSLSYLQKFPFDRLKIDRAFVASLGTTGNTGAIIQSIVTLGHALGMKVLAEGVENNEQRVLLRLAGCDEMQGFLFAKPRPAEVIDKILAQPPAARAGAAS